MNRVTSAVERMESNIKSRIEKGLTTETAIETMRQKLDMEIGEYCRFQEIKSLAMMEGKLNLEEAQTIYGFLGETPDHFNKQSAAVKAVLTQIFSELLTKKMA